MELSTRRPDDALANLLCTLAALPLRLPHLLVEARWLLCLAMLSLMLFRPPGSDFFPFDRIAFVALCAAVGLYITGAGHPFRLLRPVTLPMGGLLLLSSCNVLCHGYSVENWSVFVAKWLAPFTLYQIATFIFPDQNHRRIFEIFSLVVLGYLCFISIAFLMRANWAIFPTYILDEGIGIHADRARGPFLQAVANGMTLNLLGLVAINSFRNRRLPKAIAIPLWCVLPVAILATRTRAVWLSFAGTVLVLMFSKSREVRRACLGFFVAAVVCLVCLAGFSQNAIYDRLQDRSPVEFRLSVYEAGSQMFLEKPLLGWGFDRMRDELGRRVSDFHQEAFYFHNTYLEVLVEHGLLGLLLYVWMMVDLFRLGRRQLKLPWSEFPDRTFRAIWPLMLAVYFVNASFVGMNYQFVNVLLFTMAGLLAAQNRVEDGLVLGR